MFSIFEKIMYPPEIVNPMKSELTSKGFVQLNSDDNIENLVKQGTSLIVINSICGCAAANARPGVLKSLETKRNPINYLPHLLELTRLLQIRLES